MQSKTIAVDLAKNVFQLAFADKNDRITKRSRVTRKQFQKVMAQSTPATFVMEGCASAHHWGRPAQRHGHTVKLLHARYVNAYLRGNKPAAAAAAAVSSPSLASLCPRAALTSPAGCTSKSNTSRPSCRTP